MRNLAIIVLAAVLSVLIGCLGMGGGGGGGVAGVGPSVPTGVVLSGRAYFPESSYYGGIPILAKDAVGLVLGSTRTDMQGNFYFSDLPPGVYSLFASTGESEVQFFSGAQVIPASPVKLPEKSLVELESAVLDQINRASVRLRFETSVPTVAQVEYGTSVGSPVSISAGATFVTSHQVYIPDLVAATRYGFTIKVQTQDGQSLTYSTMYTNTASAVGPENISLNINNGDIKTRLLSNRIYLNAENAVQMRVGNSEDLTSQPWESYSNTRDIMFTAGDGTRRIFVQFRDALGNLSPVVNDSILLQTDNTGYIGVWVNNGEALTNKLDVLLTILYPGATHMQVSDRPDFLNAFWETYTNVRKMQIPSGDGPKSVYVKFRGGGADENKYYSATIVLDTAGPNVEVAIDDGALKTNKNIVQLSFSYSKQPVEMQIQTTAVFGNNSAWVKFASPYKFALPSGDGEKVVYARFKDSLGNVSPVVESRITLDTKSPENPSMLINAGAETTQQLAVKLTLDVTADDNEQVFMKISNNENFSGAVLENFAKTKSWTLGGYGLQNVYAIFYDDASNSTPLLVESIEVEGEPPSSGTVKINDGDPSSDKRIASLKIYSESAVRLRIAEHENFSSVDDTDFVPNAGVATMRIDNFYLSPTAGEKRVYVRMEDASGSFSISSDSIMLVGPASYSITTSNEQPLSSFSVDLRPFAINASQMLITESYADMDDPLAWRPFAFLTTFPLEEYAGRHTIYAKFRNAGEVETPVLSLDVIVGTVLQATPAIILNMGDAIAISSKLDVKVLTPGLYSKMQLSNDGIFYNAAELPAEDTTWNVAHSEGLKTVYARFFNPQTNESEIVFDTITAQGPASPTISTSDAQPLNKNWVQLDLYAENAVEMLVSEDPGIKNLNTGWVDYQPSLVYTLGERVGARTIYAKFRNATADWVETLPVQLNITVNSTSPTGNTATFRETAAADSSRVTEILPASMPIFLHFGIVDTNTASVAWKIVAGGSAVPEQADFKVESVPVAPIILTAADFSGFGVFNLYYQFSDGAGNKSSLGVTSIRIIDPSQVVVPVDGKITINYGDGVSESSRLNLNFLSSNAAKFRYSPIESFALADGGDYNGDPNGMNVVYNVPQPVAGPLTIYARFEDAAGNFGFASDTITLVGPTNASMNLLDQLPLNKKWVELSLNATNASRMLISQNLASFTNPSPYLEPYSTRKTFTLEDRTGTHVIYCKFYNSTTDWVETELISLSVVVNSAAPSGNTASFHTEVTPDSEQVSEISPASMPFYLHFNIADALTATISYRLVRADQPVPASLDDFAVPILPIRLEPEDFLGYGVFNLYYRFADGVGNQTPVAILPVRILDPGTGYSTVDGNIVINGGDSRSGSNIVNLLLHSETATKFKISETESFSSVVSQDFLPDQNFNMLITDFPLSSTAGQKTVFVRFENASEAFIVVNDSIELTGPENYSLTTLEESPLATYTVNLRPFANNVNEMLLTEDFALLASEAMWVSFTYSVNFPLGKTDGKHTVYAKYRNVGRVETPVISLDVTVAANPPASPSIMINSGDAFTENAEVWVNVTTSADFSSTLKLSEDGDFHNILTETPAAPQTFVFANKQAGEKTVYARFKHNTRNEYVVVSDTITARGPASATISTRDTMPLNKNWVDLDLFAVGASQMKISTSIASLSDPLYPWESYSTKKVFSLGSLTGNMTIYCVFRNSSSSPIESVPVSLNVTVSDSSPTGNTAALRKTVAPTSDLVTEVPVGSLPVYLHFEVNDPKTTSISFQLASGGAPIPTTFRTTAVPVAPIVLDQADFEGNGTFNVYYKFSDGVGNETQLQIVSVKVLGPSLKISPQSVEPLFSGQTQQFLATLENVEGTVRWTISPSSDTSKYGSINSNTGLYTAPANITTPESVTVKAELFGNSEVYDEVTLNLQTQVEISVSPVSYKISKGEVATITVRFVNSSQIGTVNIADALGGTAQISAHPDPAVPPTDTLASLTYYAPADVPNNNPVAVEIVSSEDPTKRKTIFFEVNEGPYVAISPSVTEMRLFDGSAVFVVECSSKTADLEWRLPDGGSFLAAAPETATQTTSTNGRHTITVFAPTVGGPTLRVSAFFLEDGVWQAGATATVSLTPRVSISVAPKAKSIYLAETTPLTLQATVANATSSEVFWEFKNASDSEWVRADAYVTAANGTLETSGIDAVYLPPEAFPASNAVDVKMINVRAISRDDGTAIAIASLTLLEALKVNIHDGFNKNALNVTDGEVDVTLEVGKRQFFADVGPVTDPTVNTTVTWYVQNVAGGNAIYGTVDTTGKYTAPDTAPQAAVTLKAVSVTRPTAFAETTINLLEFWIPRSDNLNDVTNATHSIYSIQIDPTTPAGSNRILYAGTNGNGVYRSSIPTLGSGYDWDAVAWNEVTNLSTDQVGGSGKYIINDIAISLQNPSRQVAATNNGLFLITNGVAAAASLTVPSPRPAPHSTAATITDYSSDFTSDFSAVTIDPTDDNYLYAVGRDQGVLRFVWNGATYAYSGTLYDDNQIYSLVEYYDWAWSVDTDPDPASVTLVTGSLSRPDNILVSSGTMEFNCITMSRQNPNVIYVGFSNYLETRPTGFKAGCLKLSNVRTSQYLYVGERLFNVTGTPPPQGFQPASPGGYPDGNPEELDNWHFVGADGIIYFDDDGGRILCMAIDPNTPSTIWKGKNTGIYRSTDDGNTFSVTNAVVNVRDIFIDPINTINVYIGAESGLYRTRDAGTTWKQIKSGLEGHTTINALGLTPGGVGTRRIFCGTTNGIFMGRTTLDLE